MGVEYRQTRDKKYITGKNQTYKLFWEDVFAGPEAKTLSSNPRGLGVIPGQTRYRMPQLRPHIPQLKILHTARKIPCAITKTQHSQERKNKRNSSGYE